MYTVEKHLSLCTRKTCENVDSIVYNKNKNKTTMRYHFTPVRMAAIQKSTSINAGEGVEKRELSYTVGGNAN